MKSEAGRPMRPTVCGSGGVRVAVAERDRKAGRAKVGRIKGLEFEGPGCATLILL